MPHTDYIERTNYGFNFLPSTFLYKMENKRSLIVIRQMKDKKEFLIKS